MAVRISTAARNAAADAIAALANGGTGPGVIRVYTGSQPTGPGSAPTGTLLAEFVLSDPAFAAAVAGSVALDTTPSLTDAGLADGTAGWFRMLDSTEAAGAGLGIVDGSVTGSGGGGDLTMNTPVINTGVTVTITAGTATMPAG
ncbi:unnamed protein product [[Actinomadura] parvosata subsp. kistnae]|uniref:Uncharacterized protein n=1 Tax=[Actinomadura] parvosata subsp. kistnae TaxID=1909395 RepID=A0A1V0ABW5_9ACTN|nr:hypothetical protein [Nonomuraea sp. ATCC 55076]AQZ67632.1 hypothetical protein BKM31_44745 [Nonomuraea sp. ATCC 55076]SPL94081.1 unnamed protein product [Actinomadura parvosata subsp. kistnae]